MSDCLNLSSQDDQLQQLCRYYTLNSLRNDL